MTKNQYQLKKRIMSEMKTYISSPGSTNGLAEHPQVLNDVQAEADCKNKTKTCVYVAVFVVVKK